VDPPLVKVLSTVVGITVSEPASESDFVPFEVPPPAFTVVVTFPTDEVVSVRRRVDELSMIEVVMTMPVVVKVPVEVSSITVAVPLSRDVLTTELVTSSLLLKVAVLELVVGTTVTELDDCALARAAAIRRTTEENFARIIFDMRSVRLLFSGSEGRTGKSLLL